MRLSSGRLGSPKLTLLRPPGRAHARQVGLDERQGAHGHEGRGGVGGDGHDQRVEPHVLGGQAGCGELVVEHLGDGETVFGRAGDAFVVEAERDDRALVLLDQRQHRVDAALLAADGVDVGDLAAVFDGRFDAGLQGGGAGGVDHELVVGDAAYGGDEPEKVFDLVAAGHAAVDVEDVRAGCDLIGRERLMNSASRAWMASPTCLRVPLIDSPTNSMTTTSTTFVIRDRPRRPASSRSVGLSLTRVRILQSTRRGCQPWRRRRARGGRGPRRASGGRGLASRRPADESVADGRRRRAPARPRFGTGRGTGGPVPDRTARRRRRRISARASSKLRAAR